MVADGEFRQDLMFRINTFEVRLPPLRERIEDIAELSRHLLKRLRPTLKPGDELFEPDALRTLEAYSWPGNVRELANVIEHAAILGDRGPIAAAQLPNKFGERKLRGPHFKPAATGTQTLREIELSVIQQILERHKGNKPRAAEELGISLKTLYNKLNQVAAAEQQTA
jgi:two-component system NtrC family response regulator